MNKTRSPIEKYFENQAQTARTQILVPLISEVRFICPEVARSMLENHTNYRRISDPTVRKYAAMMSRGEWHQESPPIIFSYNGTLVDGQHRLAAVVKSGFGQWFYCLSGDIDYRTPDGGKSRTPANILEKASEKGDIQIDGFFDKAATAARNIHAGPWTDTRRYAMVGNSDYVWLYEQYKDAIDMMQRSGLFQKGRGQAPVYGAIGRAWYFHQDRREEIEAASKAYASLNFPGDRYSGLQIFARAQLSTSNYGAKMEKGKKHPRTVDYLKMCRAIELFLDRQPVKYLYAAKEDPFPIETMGY